MKYWLAIIWIIHSMAFGIDFRDGFGKSNLLLDNDLTQEDKHRYEQFEEYYQRFKNLNPISEIPKKLHFIWIGPFQPPEQYKTNILSWIRYHADWEVILWTDRPIQAFDPALTIRRFESQYCESLQDEYSQTLNYSERATLASYAILKKHGGVYVECDVECFQAIDSITDKCDFFCPVEFEKETCLSSAIHAGKYILAASINHPILCSCIERIRAKWDWYTHHFIGNDEESNHYRLKYRCVHPVTEAIFEKNTLKSIVLPPVFFTSISERKGIYSHHHQLHTIESTRLPLEKLLIEKSKRVVKEHNRFNFLLTMALSILAFIQMVLLISWYAVFRTRSKR